MNRDEVIAFFNENATYYLPDEGFSIDGLIDMKKAHDLDADTWQTKHYKRHFELNEKLISLGLTESECVEVWGGEGEGDDIGRVHYFPEIDLYLRINGYYESHYGTEWYKGVEVVYPKEKTITVYVTEK